MATDPGCYDAVPVVALRRGDRLRLFNSIPDRRLQGQRAEREVIGGRGGSEAPTKGGGNKKRRWKVEAEGGWKNKSSMGKYGEKRRG